MSEPLPAAPVVPAPAPALADGVEVLGPLAGSGYRVPPVLVRRGDGQMMQLTPLLGAVLEAIDGRRGPDEIAEHVEQHHRRALHPEDVDQLIEAKLRPLGLLRTDRGSAPAVRRADPLLGLRGRIQLAGPDRTHALAGPFLWLFRPAVVVAVLAAFAGFSTWVLLRHGLGTAIDEAIADPALLLGVVALVLASGAFHELGHATACRYGGARPRAMGAAVYLVWPAFYTDVTDSYRLDRGGRLRVDLGGLYFNAVFTCATGVAWALTGTEALLVLVPVQLLQMARQLVPIVRFDGYHILADLVGVPDLFARIRPTLARALPGRRRRSAPSPLTRRAQLIVVGWVAVVVPFLLVSLGLLLWNLPSIMAAAVRSLDAQRAVFLDNVSAGHVAAAALGVVAMATVAFLPASATYLLARLARRTSARFWSATDGRPGVRATAVAALAVALLATAPGLVPNPPERADADLAGSVVDGEVTELAAGPGPRTAYAPRRPEPAPGPAVTPAPRAVAPAVETTSEPAPAPAPVESAATPRVAPVPAPATIRAAWPFSFEHPAAPRPGDNQALAVGTVDGASRSVWATSLQWPTDGRLDHRNEAWALAQCVDCRTLAVAFQVVAAVGEVPTAVPRNVAVSVNEGCDTCQTAAVAVQVAVTLDELPPPPVRAQVQRVVARTRGLQGTMRGADAGQIRAELHAARAEVLELLTPWLAEVAGTDQVDEVDEDERDQAAAEDAAQDAAVTSEPTAVPTVVTVDTASHDALRDTDGAGEAPSDEGIEEPADPEIVLDISPEATGPDRSDPAEPVPDPTPETGPGTP